MCWVSLSLWKWWSPFDIIITKDYYSGGEMNQVFDCVSAGFDRSNPNSAGNSE